jgi:hypothetical protein
MSYLLFQHRYPHTSHAFAEQPAPLLKGADAVLFAVAKALGLHVRFVIHLYKLEAGSNVGGRPDGIPLDSWTRLRRL